MNDQEQIAKLKMQRGGIKRYSSLLTLTQDSLQHEWESWRDTGDRTFALSELSPRLGSREASPRESVASARQGVFIIIVAALLLASPLRGDLILLISFLGLIGIIQCSQGLPGMWAHRRWTVIQKQDGSAAFHIPHDLCVESERKAFEKAFASRMETERIPTTSSTLS